MLRSWKQALTSLTSLTMVFALGCRAFPQPVSGSDRGAYEASLQPMDEGFVVTWHDYRDGNAEIYLRRLGPRGIPLGPERRLTTSPALSFEADVTRLGPDVLVAWYDRLPDGRRQARVGRWNLRGEPGWEKVLSSAERTGRNPVVRVVGEDVFCAWLEDDTDGSAVWGVWLTADGERQGRAQRLAPAGPTTWNLNAAVTADGEIWVVFDASVETRAHELYLARVVSDTSDWRATVARLTPDDGVDSKYPDVAMGSGAVAVTWFDERDGNREVYLAVTQDALAISDQLAERAVRVTATPGESIGAYLAWNHDRIGLAWSDDVDGQHEIFFEAFDASGQVIDGPRRLTTNRTASLIPAIDAWADGFALVWNEDVIEARGTHETGGQSQIMFTLVH